MQFLAMNGTVDCPACGSQLSLMREIDRRLAVMAHGVNAACPCNSKQYRVDRKTGYAEELVTNETKPTEIQVPSRRISP